MESIFGVCVMYGCVHVYTWVYVECTHLCGCVQRSEANSGCLPPVLFFWSYQHEPTCLGFYSSVDLNLGICLYRKHVTHQPISTALSYYCKGTVFIQTLRHFEITVMTWKAWEKAVGGEHVSQPPKLVLDRKSIRIIRLVGG